MITLRQIKMLTYAVDEAEDWRGSLIGCAPKEVIDEFDQRIADMRKAVKEVRFMRDELFAAQRKIADFSDYKDRS